MEEKNRAQLRAAAELRRLEALRLVPYRDEGGVWTVGYGHCCRSDCGPIAEQEAEALLMADIAVADSALVGLVLSEGQRVALIIFIFNIGVAAFEESTIRRLLVARQMEEAAHEFGRWIHIGKGAARRVCRGLVNRQAAVRLIFLGGAS